MNDAWLGVNYILGPAIWVLQEFRLHRIKHIKLRKAKDG